MKITFEPEDNEYVKSLMGVFGGEGQDYINALAYVQNALNQPQVIYDEVKSYFENKEEL